MESMIYYPGFEIQDEKWLKFALLYFEEIRPIIPYMCVREDQYLTQNAIKVMEKTNLIRPYQPEYVEGECASFLACEMFDKYLQNPARYSRAFTGSSNINIAEYWRNREFHNCNLYNGKFSTEFYDYCIDNGLAHPFDNGIKISKDLAFVYMSFLADTISKNKGLEMFTDISRYNKLLMMNDRVISNEQQIQLKIIDAQIDFILPGYINRIPLEKIIELRSNRDFEYCRRAYIKEMEKYLARREGDPNYSFDEQLRLKKEIQRFFALLGSVTASVYLTCSEVLSFANGSSSVGTTLATIGSNVAAAVQIKDLPKYIKDIYNKKQAKRYIGHIRKVY